MTVLEYLQSWRKLLPPEHLPKSMPEVLLRNGRPFRLGRRPADIIKLGQLKDCYRNAALVAMNGHGERFVYVEGVAQNIIPMQHAWLFDTQTGLAVDVTWRRRMIPKHPDYFGIPFTKRFLIQVLAKAKYYGLLEHPNLTEIVQAKPEEFLWKSTSHDHHQTA